MRFLTILVLLIVVAQPLEASPGASTWYRQALLGENGSSYFLLETRWVNRGTYYQHTEYQRVVKLNKYTDAIEDTIIVRKTAFTTNLDTGEISAEEQATPLFDLAAFIRQNEISAPFTKTWTPRAELDSTGLFVDYNGKRETIVPMDVIRQRIPASREFYEEPKLLGAEFTTAPSDSGTVRMTYYRISMASAGGDTDGVELILRVPGGP